MSTLERAIAIVAKAHVAVLDDQGAAMRHSLRVMNRVHSPEQRIVAVLHEVLDETPLTLSDLARAGFPLKILAAVNALARRCDESEEAFAERVADDPIARVVRLADLAEHPGTPSPELLARLGCRRAQPRFSCSF